MPKKAGLLHIGTSGWSYKDWKGLYYPEKMKPVDYLGFYSQEFDCTEINTSFYHLPKAQTVINWKQKVPPPFLFCPKMSRYITHYKKLRDTEGSLRLFFNVFDLMADKLGPVLIQLPAQVTFDAGVAGEFFSLLSLQYPDYQFSIEVRDDSWLKPESLSIMEQYNIGLVIAHSGKLFSYKEAVTAQHIYLRFHGTAKLYASKYTAATLKKYAGKTASWIREGHQVWAFFNNDYYGYALENARTLLKLINA